MNKELNNNLLRLTDTTEPNVNNNTIISGLSIKMALVMLLNGSEGESKEELLRFLGNITVEELNQETKSALEECGESLKLANTFWFHKPYIAKEEFKQIIKEYQNADAQTDDFDDPSSLDKVNNWVKENTNGFIEKVLEKLDSSTTSMLINTLYFKAQWSKPFPEYNTKDDTFHGLDRTSTIKMMANNTSSYYENQFAKGFGLTYEESPYEFIGVLPNNEGEFNISDLDLNNFLKQNGNYRVNLEFPKLDIEYSTQLEHVLPQLGLRAPFNNPQDFNKMLNISQLVQQIIHKTNFKLDEKGTEAAAATVVMMTRGMAPNFDIPTEINLRFDRPFAFMIRHRITNELLFIGKINNL